VAIANFNERGVDLVQRLFLPALTVLTREGDAGWIFDAWFRRELRDVLAVLDQRGVRKVLENLLRLPRIDYHAEEVLCSIARSHAADVISFFRDRIEIATKRKGGGRKEFEAVPFEFHKLQKPLAVIPREAVHLMRKSFESDKLLFQFRGGRL